MGKSLNSQLSTLNLPLLSPLLLGLSLCASLCAAEAPLPKGHVFYQSDFESPEPLKGWTGQARLEPGYQSAHSCAIQRPGDGAQRPASVLLPLPVAAMRGYTIRGTLMVKARQVSPPPNPWNGIKFMLIIETPEQKLWPQAPIGAGDFDWKRVGFMTRIPDNATSVQLCLGLEEVTGSVWFDDLKLTVAKSPAPLAVQPLAGEFKPHNLPRLRGTMISPSLDAAGLRVLGHDWNANLIRWQLIRTIRPGQPGPLADYDQWLEGELRRLDALLPECEKYGVYVALDLHSPPGGKATVSGYVGTDDRLFTDRAVQAKFVEVWRRIATRYKDAKCIWGYDLANEPVEEWVEENCDDWHDLAERAAKAIREIDPARAIIVEAPPWGSPESLADFTPIAVSNVVYSAHMYVPIAFTHQGVFQNTKQAWVYPGLIDGKQWDKAALAKVLQPVRDFQQRWQVPIYMGEFSAIRWAPDHSAHRYLRDVIELFESYGWDWTYHAFREWDGWSVEHGSDRRDTQPAATPTDRERLLREWFAKNRKPDFARDGDSAKLLPPGATQVLRLQTQPDLARQMVKVKIFMKGADAGTNALASTALPANLVLTLREARSRKFVSEVHPTGDFKLRPGEECMIEVSMPVPNGRPWTEEDRFLYELEAVTGTHSLTEKFGMR